MYKVYYYFFYFRLLALKALNSRLIDGTKDMPRVNMDSERNDAVVISIGDSDHSSQVSSSNAMTSHKTT